MKGPPVSVQTSSKWCGGCRKVRKMQWFQRNTVMKTLKGGNLNA